MDKLSDEWIWANAYCREIEKYEMNKMTNAVAKAISITFGDKKGK